MNLSQTQLAQLKLFRSQGVGPVIYKKLMDKYGSAEIALAEFPQLNKQFSKNLQAVSDRVIDCEIKLLEKLGGELVFYDDPHFPQMLKFIHDCPPLLTVLGQKEVLNKKQIAIVGNRNASAPAIKFTKLIAKGLVENNFVATSGLARGIDSAAHVGTLDAGGQTIAVLAGGVDHIYPPENEKLYRQIMQSGAIVSEMPLGMAPTQNHFPRRNRIVSGLSLGVAVIEAAKKSGSLITARLAAEQGREVFAVPGGPMDSRTSGPNYLLQNGATMLQSIDDILENIPSEFSGFKAPEQSSLLLELPTQENKMSNEKSKEEKALDVSDKNEFSPEEKVLNLLSPNVPVPLDEMVRLSGLPEPTLLALLTDMDLDGLIARQSGGFVRK